MESFLGTVRSKYREWRASRDPAAAFVLSEYRKNGGIILGSGEEQYRLKVTLERMEIIRPNPDQPITDPEAEKALIQNWLSGYVDTAVYTQRYLRVALGLPADLPKTPMSPETKRSLF